MNIIQHPSPNFRDTRKTTDFIILHGTWMHDDASTLERLRDPGPEVSCHYYIGYDAQVYQLVDDAMVSYHAGVSKWGDTEGLNDHSIGIEIANPGPNAEPPFSVPYTSEQYEALRQLLKMLMAKHDIPSINILAHSDIAPDRKDDPGVHFDWEELAELNISQRK